jgi:hypothetical protein
VPKLRSKRATNGDAPDNVGVVSIGAPGDTTPTVASAAACEVQLLGDGRGHVREIREDC